MNEITTDRRVSFDFEIEFSNGGGIQGQDFRLDLNPEILTGHDVAGHDIAGHDIDDDALAAYIIRDMRLLMVGAVRILNKRVIEEAHKRSDAMPEPGVPEPGVTEPGVTEPGVTDTGVSKSRRTIVDLSHVIEDQMITYQGLPGPLVCDHLSRIASRDIYAEGTEFQIGRIEMVGNTGTYIDVPFHRYADGFDLTALPLEATSGIPGVVVRVTGAAGRAIDWQHFAAIECGGRAVLVHTGWDQRWRTDAYFAGHPFLTEAAGRYLSDQGAALVGIDSYNIDNTDGGTRPVHSVLLGAGILIVEHMTNLGALPADGFRFHATPPKIAGMGTFPVRAHAVIDDEQAMGTSRRESRGNGHA